MTRDVCAFALLAATATAAASSPPQMEPAQIRVNKVVDVFGDEPMPNAHTAGGRVFTFMTPAMRCGRDDCPGALSKSFQRAIQ
jgi:hypothetical protein